MKKCSTAYIFLNDKFDRNFACEGLEDAKAEIQKVSPSVEFTTICDTAAEGHDKAAGHELLILIQSAE